MARKNRAGQAALAEAGADARHHPRVKRTVIG